MSSLTDVQIEAIAKVCHETNRAFCQTLGDSSQPAWESAPDWQKSSAIDGVKFHLLNPAAGPEASHENWSREKIANGWTYGSTKNPDLKTHPCLVDFNQLPVDQQKKDHLFKAVVKSLAW